MSVFPNSASKQHCDSVKVMHAVCCSEWPCCSPAVQFPVRELGQFSEGQCTLTPVTNAMGLQMTGCKEAPDTKRTQFNGSHEEIIFRFDLC